MAISPLFGLLIAGLSGCANEPAPPAAPAPPVATGPSLVLVTLDTTRADRLGCYGGSAPTPALDRLGQVFPSADDYLIKMKEAPYIHPWSAVIETYYRYELEEVEGGVRTNIDPAHIQEEAANVRQVDCAPFYPKIKAKVLILRAPKGLLSQKDLLLPDDVIKKMMAEIPDVQRFDAEGMNHYGIVFQPHAARDAAIREFLKD